MPLKPSSFSLGSTPTSAMAPQPQPQTSFHATPVRVMPEGFSLDSVNLRPTRPAPQPPLTPPHLKPYETSSTAHPEQGETRQTVLFTEGPGTGNSFHSVEANPSDTGLEKWAGPSATSGADGSNLKIGLSIAGGALVGAGVGVGSTLLILGSKRGDSHPAEVRDNDEKPLPDPTDGNIDPGSTDNWPDDPSWAYGGSSDGWWG